MTVGVDGQVTACVTVASSGSKSLDDATCSIFTRRARFSPAIGADGRPTVDTHIARLRWRVES
jgi:protein TonB